MNSRQPSNNNSIEDANPDRKITIKKRNVVKTVPERQNPNKKLDPLIVDSNKSKRHNKLPSYEMNENKNKLKIPKDSVR